MRALVLQEFVATLAAALFAGAALYINVTEHPARMTLDTKFAASQWAPSYRRATWLQAPLALLSLVAGLSSWILGAGLGWAIAALLIGAVAPFTLIGIMPTNKSLCDSACAWILTSERRVNAVSTRLLHRGSS